jgi:carboxymethylenebutenolidase
MPAPVDVADQIRSPVLGIFGGADEAIPASSIDAFRNALVRAGLEHRIVSYDGAPHSFFDRRASDFAAASEAAWMEVQAFILDHTPTSHRPLSGERGSRRGRPGR